MRIVYICDFFHPDAGYHPNLLSKYWSRFGHEVYMLTSELDRMPSSLTRFFDCSDIDEKDKTFETLYHVKVIRCPIFRFVSGRSVYKGSIFRIIRNLHPDVVYVNGNDTLIGIQLTLRYKRAKYGLVMDSHMLDMASKNRFKQFFRKTYRLFVAPIILKNDIPVIRAQDDDYLEKHLGLPLCRCPWISFGSDMLLFHPDTDARNHFRESYNIDTDAFVVLYAGKVNTTKGMDLFAEAIRNKFKTQRKLLFVIVGSTEGVDGGRIEAILQKSENQVLRFPTQKYTDLPRFYQMADIAVFPKQCSLSFFDVQACGLPVVFEDNNINESRCAAQSAIVFRPDDMDSLRNAILKFAEMDEQEFSGYSLRAIEYVRSTYNYEEKAREYLPYLEQQAKKKQRN